MTTKLLVLVSVVVIAALGISCDLGINPLLFDGTPVTATFRVDKVVPSYDTTVTENLHTVVANISKNIDSIKVFNITLQIDSTAGTAGGTTITGTAEIDGNTLLTVTGAAISLFASERSIFDTTLGGKLAYGNAGVAHLIALFNAYSISKTLPTITLHSSGNASSSPLHFTIKLKLYTQIFTPPPKS